MTDTPLVPQPTVTQCVILAGGLATRMRPLTTDLPKALLPVAGRPFADHQLAWLAAQGVTSVVYCVGYLGEMIEAHVGDGSQFGLHVAYVTEGEHLLGTGGALRLALDAGVLDDDFLSLYGDSYLNVSIADVAAHYRATDCDALMTVLPIETVPGERANANIDGAYVGIYDKSPSPDVTSTLTHIDYGLSVFSSESIATHVPSDTVVDLASVQHQLSVAGRLAAFPVSDPFHEIGSREGLRALNELLSS